MGEQKAREEDVREREGESEGKGEWKGVAHEWRIFFWGQLVL